MPHNSFCTKHICPSPPHVTDLYGAWVVLRCMSLEILLQARGHESCATAEYLEGFAARKLAALAALAERAERAPQRWRNAQAMAFNITPPYSVWTGLCLDRPLHFRGGLPFTILLLCCVCVCAVVAWKQSGQLEDFKPRPHRTGRSGHAVARRTLTRTAYVGL